MQQKVSKNNVGVAPRTDVPQKVPQSTEEYLKVSISTSKYLKVAISISKFLKATQST